MILLFKSSRKNIGENKKFQRILFDNPWSPTASNFLKQYEHFCRLYKKEKVTQTKSFFDWNSDADFVSRDRRSFSHLEEKNSFPTTDSLPNCTERDDISIIYLSYVPRKISLQ